MWKSLFVAARGSALLMMAKQESGKPLGPTLSSLYLVVSCWLPLDCTLAFGSQAELSAGGGSSCTRLCAPRGGWAFVP